MFWCPPKQSHNSAEIIGYRRFSDLGFFLPLMSSIKQFPADAISQLYESTEPYAASPHVILRN